MVTVQCPNCGAINPNGKRLLARCQQCNVYLAACRYCLCYDKRMMDCTHPARPEELLAALRDQNPPIIATIAGGRVLLNLATVRTSQLAHVRESLGRVLAESDEA